MISNTSISTPVVTPMGSCSKQVNDQCVCKVVSTFSNATNATTSSLLCDCNKVKNYTVANPSICQCTVLKDSQNNELRNCNCPVLLPDQFAVDQECACNRVTDVLKNSTSLSCYDSCGIATAASPIVFPENKCSCVTAFNASTNKTYQSCVCKNVPQCADPASFVQPDTTQPPAPCKINYPCSCAAVNGSSNLTCTCQNPQSKLSTQTFVDAKQCQCALKANSQNNTFEQTCSCCLAEEFVRKNLLAPVTCSRPDDLKEACTCLNQTVSNTSSITTLTCNCQHPTTNVLYSAIQYPSQGMCDCENVTLGSKACKCCVPYAIQSVQSQPVCAANSTSQSCQCSIVNGKYNCSCVNSRNGFTFPNLSTLNSTSCYCDPADSFTKPCNCCVSEAQYQQVKPQCPASREATTCKCDPVANSTKLSCACNNRFFLNQVTPAVSFNQSQCSCAVPAVNQTAGFDCQCCATQSDVNPSPKCAASDAFASCNSCKFNATTNQVSCACTGGALLDLSTPVSLPAVTLNTSACNCVFDGTKNNCNCCVNKNTWITAVPTCSGSQTLEKCTCAPVAYYVNETRYNYTTQNSTKNYSCKQTGCSGELCASSDMISSCVFKDSFACYATAVCEYQASSGKCDFTPSTTLTNCLAKPTAIAKTDLKKYQNITRNATVTTVITPVNVTVPYVVNVTKYKEVCTCNNSKFPQFPISPAPTTSAQCGAASADANNTQYQCCMSNDLEENLFYNNLTCSAATSVADCACNNATSKNATCSCSPKGSQVTYKNLLQDATKCQCIAKNGTQACKCCLPPKEALMPKAPTCNSTTSTSQSCECEDSFSAGANKTIYKCACKQGYTVSYNETKVVLVNSTKTRNVTMLVPVYNNNTSSNSSTSNTSTSSNVTVSSNTSTTTTNGTTTSGNLTIGGGSSNGTVKAAATNGTTNATNTTTNATTTTTSSNVTSNTTTSNSTSTNSTAANSTSSNSSSASTVTYKNVTVVQTYYEMENKTVTSTATRTEFRTNNVNLLKEQCTCLPYTNGSKSLNACTCCVANAFTCAASSTIQQQDCNCQNVTATVNKVKVTTQQCNCLRQDNGVRGIFVLPNNQCGCNPADAPACQCCLNATQYMMQLPVLTCNASVSLKEACACDNNNVCNCTKADNGIVARNIKMRGDQCINPYNNGSFQCCVPQVVVDQQIPRADCSVIANTTSQFCQCSNTVVNVTQGNTTVSQKAYACSCQLPQFLQPATYTLPTNACVYSNSSVSECCLTKQQIAQQIPKLTCPSTTDF